MKDINRTLLTIVLEKTNKKLLTWSKGSSANEYRLDMLSATLSISLGTGDDLVEWHVVNMYNGTGNAICLACEAEGAEDFELLSDLYSAAKDSCTKETETISNLINELRGLGDIVEG